MTLKPLITILLNKPTEKNESNPFEEDNSTR